MKFFMSIQEQVIIRKRFVYKMTSKLELNKSDSEEYKIESINNSKVYTKKSDSDDLSDLY